MKAGRELLSRSSVGWVLVAVAVIGFVAVILSHSGDEGRILFSRHRLIRDFGPGAGYVVTQELVIDVDGGNVQALTGRRYDTDPAWSPDGSVIAFASDRDGDFELFVMDADGSNLRQLTHADDWDDTKPVWSPDGARILFTATRYDSGLRHVFVVDADGGDRRQLTLDLERGGYHPRWSPDSSHIAFLSWRAIVLVDADGENRRQLTDRRHPDLGDGRITEVRSFVWSPDGDIIYFTTPGGVFSVHIEGSRFLQLTKPPDHSHEWEMAGSVVGSRIAFLRHNPGSQLMVLGLNPVTRQEIAHFDQGLDNLDWSPDGDRIAFTDGLGRELFVVDADGANLESLTQDGGFLPRWSPDGSQIAFQRQGEIFLIDPDSTHQRNLTNNNQESHLRHSPDLTLTANLKEAFRETGEQAQVVWSPDNTLIALYSGSHIHVADADGTNIRQIADNNLSHIQIAWSPHSDRIAFTGDDGDYEILVADVETGTVNQLTHNIDDDFRPVWSPDGTSIAFTRQIAAEVEAEPRQPALEGTHVGIELWAIDADGTNPRRLADDIDWKWTDMITWPEAVGLWSYGPVWSPDNTRIAFSSGNQVYTVNPNGTGLQRVAFGNHEDINPVWSPDGTHFAYLKDTHQHIAVVHANSSKTTLITTDNAFGSLPAWSPDGTLIAFTRQESEWSQEVYVVEPDGSNLRQVTRGGGLNPRWIPK